MWSIGAMQPVFGGSPVTANIDDLPAGGGAGGSIFRATSPEIHESICIKVLPDMTMAGEARGLARFISTLGTREIDTRLSNPSLQGQLRRNLQSIRDFLPTHYAFCKVPNHDSNVMCLLRRWCTGRSLSELLNDPQSLLNTDSRYRLEIAKQLCRLLVGLSVFGVTHLDCYPDNIFVEDVDRETTVTLIDLEGVGYDPSAFVRDQFDGASLRYPLAYEKEGMWIVPWWYPQQGHQMRIKDAARWQLLMALLCVLTRTHSACFMWITADAWRCVEAIAREIRLRGTSPSAREVEQLEALMTPTDAGLQSEYLQDCFGAVDLADQLRGFITRGIIGPNSNERRLFLTNEQLKDLQSKLTHVHIS